VHHIKYYIQLLNDDGNKKNIKPLKHKLPVHRMAVVNLGTFLMQFLESLVPLEMVRTVLHPSVRPDLSYGSFVIVVFVLALIYHNMNQLYLIVCLQRWKKLIKLTKSTKLM